MAKDEFYKTFAKYYHKVFPVNLDSILSFKDTLIQGTLLDVGTGSGEYAALFQSEGFVVTAIDLSREMIKAAKARHKGINFIVTSMLTYKKPNYFNNILCLGSTIAHLKNIDEIRAFIDISLVNLKSGGVLVIKSLDYSFALVDAIMSMPTLTSSDGTVTLMRDYEIKNNDFFFNTTLVTNNGTFKAQTKLYPVTKSLMVEILAGLNATISSDKNHMTIIIKKE